MTNIKRSAYKQHGAVAAEPDSDSAWWWEALSAGNFLLPYCQGTEQYFFPPMPRSPYNGSTAVTARDASTGGSIYSWIVIERALDEAFVEDVPYTIVAVTMDDGPRLFGRLMAGVPADGSRVEAQTYAVEGQTLLGFASAP